MRSHAERGFTLIEILVALAIFGVVSLTLLTQSREQTRQAASLEDRLLAHWVASNTLTELQTGGGLPDLGKQESSTVMAGRDWFIVINAGTTPSTDVRSLEIQVMSYDPLTNQQSDALVTLVGFVGRSGTRGGG